MAKSPPWKQIGRRNVGIIGILGGLIGWLSKFESTAAFTVFWSGVCVAAMAGAFVLVRRQAIKDKEPLWSPPTRRVIQAMLPAFFIGLLSAILLVMGSQGPQETERHTGQQLAIIIWRLLYGSALHAAGFFTPRGLRLLGWAFILIGASMALLLAITDIGSTTAFEALSRHLQMGVLFGVSHLLFGIYLYFTEPRRNET